MALSDWLPASNIGCRRTGSYSLIVSANTDVVRLSVVTVGRLKNVSVNSITFSDSNMLRLVIFILNFGKINNFFYTIYLPLRCVVVGLVPY